MGNAVFGQILYGIYKFLEIVSDVVFVYCILTWIYMPIDRLLGQSLYRSYSGSAKSKILSFLKQALSKIFYFLQRFTQPLLAPFRRLQSMIMGGRFFPVDFSVLFLFFAIRIAQRIVAALYSAVMYR